jgi:cation transport ATPase
MERERIIEPTDRVEPDIRVTPVHKPDVDVMQATTQVVTPRDRVRWGPIWAGLLTTLTTFLVLELLMYALGLLTIDVDPNAANSGGPWVTAIVGLLAFLAGGWVAGATSAVRGTSVGLLNGFLVWALATVLIIVFSTLGLSQLFGAIGSVISQFVALGRFVPNNVDPAQVAATVRDASMWGVVSLALTAAAAAIGGWLGVKSGPLGQLPHADERT